MIRIKYLRKNNKRIALFFLPPAILLLLYGSGWLAQLIQNYDKFREAGNVPNSQVGAVFPSTDFFVCLNSLFHYPYGLYGIAASLILLVILCVFIMRMGRQGKGGYDAERNISYSDKGTYGTSGFMDETEMKDVLKLYKNVAHCKGLILGELDGKIVCLPEKSRLNRNVAVYGASGSMKSRAYCRNAIFELVRRGESGIINDPKSELYTSMGEYLRENGYVVKVFNLIDPEYSDSWHCLAEVGADDLQAQLFADIVIGNTSGKTDNIWPAGEKNLLKALVLYVSGLGEGKDTIGTVAQILCDCSDDEIDQLFSVLPNKHPAKVPYGLFMKSEPKLRSGIIVGLGLKLQVFQNQLINEITSHRDIDLTLPGKQKCAYFCISSDQDSTFDFLTSLFINFLFVRLVRYADRFGKNGVLPVPVHILADELANSIGSIPNLTKK